MGYELKALVARTIPIMGYNGKINSVAISTVSMMELGKIPFSFNEKRLNLEKEYKEDNKINNLKIHSNQSYKEIKSKDIPVDYEIFDILSCTDGSISKDAYGDKLFPYNISDVANLLNEEKENHCPLSTFYEFLKIYKTINIIDENELKIFFIGH